MLEVRLLGQFSIQLDDKPVEIASRPAQSLLAYLILTAGTGHRREQLAGIFWPDTAEVNARSNLRHALWRIRKALRASRGIAHEYLIVDDITVTFNTNAAYWLDVAVLSRELGQGSSADEWTAAVSVYRGELLPGFYDEWAVLERERIRAVFDHQMQGLLNRLVEEQRWTDVSVWAERWIALDGSPELAYRVLMIAYAGLGDTSGVVSVYRRCVAALRDELGVEPSEQTRALYQQLKQGNGLALAIPGPYPQPQPEPVVGDQVPTPGKPPFKGLRYFDEVDADLFFGRERLVAHLVTNLSPFLAIVGASGSGKSSVVRAGMIPALKRTTMLDNGARPPTGSSHWDFHVITPTAHPLEALAATLARDDPSVTATATLIDDLARDPRSLRLAISRRLAESPRPDSLSSGDAIASIGSDSGARHLLLIVDQFEELFTLCRGEDERRAFVDNLMAAVQPGESRPATIVIALRADFYGHCAQYGHLREMLARHQEFIGPMTAEELRRAIEEPARRSGWDFEPGLVDLMLRDVSDEPGALPLLSHALLETWLRRRGRVMTLGAYAESGGVRGAIARTAESVFNHRLTSRQQVIARNVFLRLTELGEGTQDTRRRAAMSELVPEFQESAAVEDVLAILAEARLVTISEATVEVAHEALIREWPTLRQWLAADREGLRVHRHLTEAANAWDGLGRDWGELYRGARLVAALEWAESGRGGLNALEREFLDASQDLARQEAAEREAQQQRELEAAQRLAETERRRAEEQSRMAGQLRRRAMWLAGAFLVAAILMIAALASGLAAVRSGQQASLNADRAAREARTARSREWAAAAVNSLDADPERGVLLALHAISETYGFDKTVLPEAVDALHRAVPASRVALTLVGHGSTVTGIAFSPDGRRIATSSRDQTLKIWDARTGQLARTVPAHVSGATAVAFSPDGRHLLSGGGVAEAKLWDEATGERLLSLLEYYSSSADVNRVAFSPDGRRFATASSDGTARLWDASTGQQVLTLTLSSHTTAGMVGRVTGVAFSPDGKHLATANASDPFVPSSPATAKVWDLATGRQLLTLTGHRSGVNAVAFSPDGTRLATAGDDATARLWDANTGNLVRTLVGHTAEVVDVAFSADGQRLGTASLDRTARIWDLASGQPVLTLSGHRGGVTGVAFGPDGMHLATSSQDSTARIWDVSPSRELLTLSGQQAGVNALAFSPDGARLATAGQDGTAKVWDLASGKAVFTVSSYAQIIGAVGPVTAVAISPDGTRLAGAVASGYSAGTVKMWDMASGKESFTLSAQLLGVTNVVFGPDGTSFATASQGKTAKVWDAAIGAERLTLYGHTDTIDGLAFSPDGTRIATGSRDGMVKLWDAGMGQPLLTLSAHKDIVWSVAFSPDGSRLATGSRDGTAKVWDVVTGKRLLVLSGHTAEVRAVAFSPDGKFLATGSGDRMAKAWNAITGEELFTLFGHGDLVSGVAFSPDGTRLATSSQDGTVRLYVLPIEETMALAQARVTRTLTPEECQKYLHLEQCPAGP